MILRPANDHGIGLDMWKGLCIENVGMIYVVCIRILDHKDMGEVTIKF